MDILELSKALELEADNREFELTTKIALAKLRNELQSKLEIYKEVRDSLIKKHGETEDGKNYFIKSDDIDKRNAFLLEKEELDKTEVKLDNIFQLKAKNIPKSVSNKFIYTFEPFIID